MARHQHLGFPELFRRANLAMDTLLHMVDMEDIGFHLGRAWLHSKALGPRPSLVPSETKGPRVRGRALSLDLALKDRSMILGLVCWEA